MCACGIHLSWKIAPSSSCGGINIPPDKTSEGKTDDMPLSTTTTARSPEQRHIFCCCCLRTNVRTCHADRRRTSLQTCGSFTRTIREKQMKSKNNIRTELRVRRREYGMEWMDGWMGRPTNHFYSNSRIFEKIAHKPRTEISWQFNIANSGWWSCIPFVGKKVFFSQNLTVFFSSFFSLCLPLLKVKINTKEILRKYWVSLNFFACIIFFYRRT